MCVFQWKTGHISEIVINLVLNINLVLVYYVGLTLIYREKNVH